MKTIRNIAIIGLLCILLSAAFANIANAQTGEVQPIPATPVTTTTTTPGPTTTSTTIKSKKFKKLVRTFQKRTHKIVVFYWVAAGLGNVRGQVDPVKRGWIEVGGKFKNTWLGRQIGWRPWRAGDKLVNVRHGHDSHGDYVEGDIVRCGNRKVRIYFNQRYVRKQHILQVAEYRSKKLFIKRNAHLIETSTSTETHTETITVYTCPEGYTLNGTLCYPPAKNGEDGVGSDTPGQPGGAGTGTSTDPNAGNGPGNTDNGEVCRNPNTGDVTTGHPDQFGYCSSSRRSAIEESHDFELVHVAQV